MKTAKFAKQCTLKIKRPNGEIEKVVFPHAKAITESQFKQIQEGTKKAGRGEVLSYENEYEYKKVFSSKAEMLYASEDHTVENMSRMGE